MILWFCAFIYHPWRISPLSSLLRWGSIKLSSNSVWQRAILERSAYFWEGGRPPHMLSVLKKKREKWETSKICNLEMQLQCKSWLEEHCPEQIRPSTFSPSSQYHKQWATATHSSCLCFFRSREPCFFNYYFLNIISPVSKQKMANVSILGRPTASLSRNVHHHLSTLFSKEACPAGPPYQPVGRREGKKRTEERTRTPVRGRRGGKGSRGGNPKLAAETFRTAALL